MLTRLFHSLASPLRHLPSQCAVCRTWDRQRVCADCIARYGKKHLRCKHCAIEIPVSVQTCGACLKQPPPFESALAAVNYEYPWNRLITELKFNAGLDLAAVLAQRLVETCRVSGLARPNWVLPVPLSTERLRERGFNQAWELTRRVAAELQISTDSNILMRSKDTPHQLSLPLERRAANVHNVFAVDSRRLSELRDQSVAVIDDVMTSGATANELARTLLRSGVKLVQIWVVARTPRAT